MWKIPATLLAQPTMGNEQAVLATLQQFPFTPLTTLRGVKVEKFSLSLHWFAVRLSHFETGVEIAVARRGTTTRVSKALNVLSGTCPLGMSTSTFMAILGVALDPSTLRWLFMWGVSQLAKLDTFVGRRKEDSAQLFGRLSGIEGLILPRATAKSDPS